MIANHKRFLEAIAERRKVAVRYYSVVDEGVVEFVGAPLDYGPGRGVPDEMHRYWIWHFAGAPSMERMGLIAPQIVDLQVLSETFDPAALGAAPWPWSVPREWPTANPPAAVPPPEAATPP